MKLFLIILCLLIVSCSTPCKKLDKNHHLTEENISCIEGETILSLFILPFQAPARSDIDCVITCSNGEQYETNSSFLKEYLNKDSIRIPVEIRRY